MQHLERSELYAKEKSRIPVVVKLSYDTILRIACDSRSNSPIIFKIRKFVLLLLPQYSYLVNDH